VTTLADLRAGRCDIALRPTDGLSLTVQLNDSAGDGIDYSAGTWTAYTRLNGRDPANALDLTVDETDANAGTIVLTETAANHTALIGLMSKWSGHWFLVYTESTIPKTFVSGTYLLDTEATNITTGAVTFTVNDAVTVTVTVNTNADATKLPLAGGSMTGPLSIDGWTELTGESPDGWPLIPFPDATNAPPLTFDDDDAGYDFAWYEHRGHLVLAQLDVGDITGNGANYWIPCITLAGPANTGITIPTAIRWNNDPTAQGSTIHPYESGIRTGKGTGMHLEADYTIVVYGNNVEAFRWSPTGLYVASGQELQVGGVDVLLDATDSVDGDNIAAGSVDTAELAADAVTGAKIGDDQIDSEHYVAGSIDNEHLADDAVDSDELAAGAVDPDAPRRPDDRHRLGRRPTPPPPPTTCTSSN